MKKVVLLCLGCMLIGLSGFAQSAPYEVRLSQQQDLMVGDIVSLEFWGEMSADNWAQFSTTPYPNFTSLRPAFSNGPESSGIDWAEGDLSRTLDPVRASTDLTSSLVMDRHELVWTKKFRINAKKVKVAGTLNGEYKVGFADSLPTLTYNIPVDIDIEARDSSIKRWLMASEKINTVLAVVVTIFLGLIVYIFITQRKLNKLTALANEIKGEKNE